MAVSLSKYILLHDNNPQSFVGLFFYAMWYNQLILGHGQAGRKTLYDIIHLISSVSILVFDIHILLPAYDM